MVHAVALFTLAIAPSTAGAATFTVDSTADTNLSACTAASDDCTLRGAINKANNDSAGPDVIAFAGTAIISIGAPLPAVTEQLTIDRGSFLPVVQGTAGYESACVSSSDFAFTFLNPAADGSALRGVPVRDVCGRAVSSPVAAPTVRIGPRRGDGTLPVAGSGLASATEADIYTTSASIENGEATTFKATVGVSGGSFSYLPSPEPGSGDLYTATVTVPSLGTSTFAVRAAKPADTTGPVYIRAVATSQSQVRLDFNEPVSQSSVVPADFVLTMANLPRAVTGATAIGNSVYLTSSLPWQTGETGYVSLVGSGAVADAVGNEVLGGPAGTVFAGPGDFAKPVLRSLKISPNKICAKRRIGCSRTATRMRVSVNERVRITTTIARASRPSRKLLSFRDRLDAGVSYVKLKNSMVGRRLPKGRLLVTVVPEDFALLKGDPVTTSLYLR